MICVWVAGECTKKQNNNIKLLCGWGGWGVFFLGRGHTTMYRDVGGSPFGPSSFGVASVLSQWALHCGFCTSFFSPTMNQSSRRRTTSYQGPVLGRVHLFLKSTLKLASSIQLNATQQQHVGSVSSTPPAPFAQQHTLHADPPPPRDFERSVEQWGSIRQELCPF